MLLSWSQQVRGRASVLISALDEREITVREFTDAMSSLTSEELQVVALILRNQAEHEWGRPNVQLWKARHACLAMAEATRPVC